MNKNSLTQLCVVKSVFDIIIVDCFEIVFSLSPSGL